MAILRVVGLVLACALAVFAVARYRRGSLRLSNMVITLLVAAGLGILAVSPSSVDPLMERLGFPPGDARRVIGTLVVSNIILYFLLLRSFGKTDRLERVLGNYTHRVVAREFERRYPWPSAGTGYIAVIVPALNEQDSLGHVLDVVQRNVQGIGVEVIVISDGSDDETELVAHQHGAMVAGCDLRQGQGAAVALGYRLALQRGARIVATCDADGQYDPTEIPRLVEPLLAGEADVVHGSRILGVYERRLPGRAQGLRVFAWLTSIFAGVRITDPASGFRALTAEALRSLTFRERQFHAGEVTVAAAKRGLRIAEVPCTFRERRVGSTKKPPLLRYGLGYTRALLRSWLG
jgi:hypothetical protein